MKILFTEIQSRVAWDISDEGCWIVVVPKKPKNRDYPTIKIRKKVLSTHRAMYMAVVGDIPAGGVIRHTCDNPMCVNPQHLLLGTKADNSKDMVDRGRQNKWKGGRNNKGLDKRRKLTESQVTEIKSSKLSSYQLADIYPVSSVQIRRIKNGSRCKSSR